jgi:hypothetical protein
MPVVFSAERVIIVIAIKVHAIIMKSSIFRNVTTCRLVAEDRVTVTRNPNTNISQTHNKGYSNRRCFLYVHSTVNMFSHFYKM